MCVCINIERERENKTTVQTCHGLKQVFIQIFALKEGFFKFWFANAVPMAANIYIYIGTAVSDSTKRKEDFFSSGLLCVCVITAKNGGNWL